MGDQEDSTKKSGSLLETVFCVTMIGIGALGGSTLSLLLGLTGGIIGAVIFASLLGGLSVVVVRNGKELKKPLSHNEQFR